jgi:hypothetical protein
MPDTQNYTYEQVQRATNRAVDDVAGALGLPSHGLVDMLHLLNNAALTYLRHPDANLEAAAMASYSEPLETILSWIRS